MINKQTIIGRLGADPELKTTTSGAVVCTLSVASSERWKDKDDIMQEDTEWHKCVAWNKLAELIGEWWQKGTLVYIEGRTKTRKWQDKDGNDKYTTEVTIREMKTLSGGKDKLQTQHPRTAEYHPNEGGMGGDVTF